MTRVKTRVWRIKTGRAYAFSVGYGWFQFDDEENTIPICAEDIAHVYPWSIRARFYETGAPLVACLKHRVAVTRSNNPR